MAPPLSYRFGVLALSSFTGRPIAERKSRHAVSYVFIRLPSATAVESGAALARCSQVGVYAISESICVTSRFAFMPTVSSYTVGFICGRPRLRNARPLPHNPESRRPARRCATVSRLPARVTRPRPSLSCAMPRVAVRSPSRKRFCSGLGGSGAGVDSARAESETGGVCAPSGNAAKQSSTARQRIRILWVSLEALVIMSQ